MSYEKKDWRGLACQIFFWYDNDKVLKRGIFAAQVTHEAYQVIASHKVYSKLEETNALKTTTNIEVCYRGTDNQAS